MSIHGIPSAAVPKVSGVTVEGGGGLGSVGNFLIPKAEGVALSLHLASHGCVPLSQGPTLSVPQMTHL